MAETQSKEKTPEEKAAMIASEQAAEIERLKAELEQAKMPKTSLAAGDNRDTTVPGGRYIVDGVPVDSEGKPTE